MRKSKEIKVRMTPEEFDFVTRCAAATKHSREEYVRQVLSGATIRASPPAEYAQILRELRRIGSNVDQILVKSRALGFVDIPMLREAVDSIRKMDAVFTDSFL